MKTQPFLQSTFTLLLIILLFSCEKTMQEPTLNGDSSGAASLVAQQAEDKVFYGTSLPLGNGTMRAFYLVNPSGKPKELGVEITALALQTLPPATSEDHAYRYVLPLPSEAFEAVPYKHVYLDWNPIGHEPDPIYGVPHFDFHFYTIPSAEREAIPLYLPETAALFDNFPLAEYLPAGYFPIPGGAPQMGKHWVDPTSPEFNGQPFSYTLIYGTYNGKVIFVEPMITLSTLLSRNNLTLPIPQPIIYSPINTYHPKNYNIYFNRSTEKYYVSLTNFKNR
jgi:hypothetical protein